jgi:PAS domain S-box-containing protein
MIESKKSEMIMILLKRRLIIVITILAFLSILINSIPAYVFGQDVQIQSINNKHESTILTAERIFEEIVIDGKITEPSWSKAKNLVITIQDGSIGQIDVELKSLYDDNYIYLYSSWPDASMNVDKNHFTYNTSIGRWYQSGDEDRIAILWNIDNSINGFNIGGCAMTCHGDRKSTNADGEIGDLWQWLAALSNPLGYADDNYLDNNVFQSFSGWTAIHTDDTLNGGITYNYNVTTGRPLFMQDPQITPSLGPEFLVKTESIEFNSTYRDPIKKIEWSDGDKIPGFVLGKPEGSRGDIEAKGVWEDGKWQIELKRKLVTGNDDDVAFDITKIYRFGIAVMDDTGGFRRFGEGHSFDLGARTLEFGGEGSEVITSLSLIRDYLLVSKGYLNDNNNALAKSEINNAYSIFESIENEVVDKDPQRYLDTKNAFEHARSHTTSDEIDDLIEEIDELILLFQGKIKPTTPSWEANFMAFWTTIEMYVFIILSIMAIYLLYLIIRTIKKKEWRRMSIFLLIITIPIFLEGTGRLGVLANIPLFYNLSFMTNEYAKLMWGILMFCAIIFSTLGFRDLDNNINMLKETEAEIKFLNAFNENVLRTVPMGIMVVEKNGRITFDNPMFKKIGNVLQIEKKKLDFFKFKKSRRGSLLNRKYQAAISRGENFEILKYPIKYGKDQVIYLNIKGEPLRNIDGEIEGVLILFEDITDRIRLEEQLFHKEKLASIGQLAAGVAHELNTPLMNISLLTENIQTLTADEKVLENINTISNQVYSAAKIVDDLLLFSRKKKTEFISVDINEILENTLLQLQEKIPENIKIIKKLDRRLPIIQGDSTLLERVYINLILNAFDAMPDGGKLSIITDKTERNVRIRFIDTGNGIPQDKIKEIFNPFYTTKGPGKGTGLGLAICDGIIHEHNGSINIESVEGKGTTIIIELPR